MLPVRAFEAARLSVPCCPEMPWTVKDRRLNPPSRLKAVISNHDLPYELRALPFELACMAWTSNESYYRLPSFLYQVHMQQIAQHAPHMEIRS